MSGNREWRSDEWRGGDKVSLNVYGEPNCYWPQGRPVCQCHTSADADRIVQSVNFAGRAAELAAAWRRLADTYPEWIPPVEREGSESAGSEWQRGMTRALRMCADELDGARMEPRQELKAPPAGWEIPLIPGTNQSDDAGSGYHPHDDWGS